MSQTIWITGASSGIGEALAKAYSKKDARLILSARRAAELERVAGLCEGPSENIKILPLDLANESELPEKTALATSFWDGIDIIINNGGISQRALAIESNPETIRKIMEVNFFGSVFLTQAILPHMVERKSGHIVVVSSVMGKFGTKYRSAYAASKHAVHGWFDCLRQEMYEHNVDITLVCPGYIRTNISLNALTADGSTFNQIGEAHKKAMSADTFAAKLIPQLDKRKDEVYIGGKEILAVYLKRFTPRLLNRILRKVKVA